MKALLTQLQDVLRQELAAYQDLLEKANQKKEALLKNDVPLLDRIVTHEENAVKTIAHLEMRRETVIQSIARANGLELSATLTELAGLLEGEEAAGLLALKDELSTVLSELDVVNNLNKELLDTHLQYTEFCVNLLTGQKSAVGTYSHSGQMSELNQSPTLVLDRSV